MPSLSKANAAVAGHLQKLLEQLAPEQLRELGIALSVSDDMVALALELVEEAADGSREDRAQSMAEFEVENQLNEDRIGDAVDVAAGCPRRLAVAAACRPDVGPGHVADLIAYAAEMSAVDALPAPLGPGLVVSCGRPSAPAVSASRTASASSRQFTPKSLTNE
ncbi:hypothetical protein [Streptomyces sp. 2A115]|uniref:hypothetical protein n=1 Tax=Streptomyces sp. 2A115 TaxID=3457439 RepID=UPI003FCF65E0